ncbi:MAG TPA: FAD-dependent oxidoreductase [Gaiellales bacterium]
MSSGRVVVVGAGVAGLCAAYYLRKREFDVTIVESNRIGSGASLRNGGWLCPAQAGPLPEPGLTLYGMRALFDRDSALYFKPGELNRLAPWLLRFRTYCNADDHAHGTAAIGQLAHEVFDLVEEMRADGVECELHKQGMVYAARSADDARSELAKLEPMRAFGYELPDGIVTGRELHELEPALSDEVDAGFLINQHWHVRPDTFTRGLADVLLRDGVEITEGAEVFELVREGRRLTHVRTAAGDIAADTVVLAAGSWTTPLAHSIGISLPMEPGKGYSFSVKPTVLPQHAVLLVDVHVGCTPYGDRIRIGGTMEFSGINSRLDRRRIASIVAGATRSFQPFETPEIEYQWAGMRPITVDGLPILDRAGELENTYIATGYAMQGVTLAPSAGKALAKMIATGTRPAMLEPFRLDRFGRLPLTRVVRRHRHAVAAGA